MLLWILRGCFGVIIIGMATLAGMDLGKSSSSLGIAAFLCVLGIGIAAVVLLATLIAVSAFGGMAVDRYHPLPLRTTMSRASV